MGRRLARVRVRQGLPEPDVVAVRVEDDDRQPRAAEDPFEEDTEGIRLSRAALATPERVPVEPLRDEVDGGVLHTDHASHPQPGIRSAEHAIDRGRVGAGDSHARDTEGALREGQQPSPHPPSPIHSGLVDVLDVGDAVHSVSDDPKQLSGDGDVVGERELERSPVGRVEARGNSGRCHDLILGPTGCAPEGLDGVRSSNHPKGRISPRRRQRPRSRSRGDGGVAASAAQTRRNE